MTTTKSKYRVHIHIWYQAFCEPKDAANCGFKWDVDSWDIDRYEILETLFKATNLQDQATGNAAKMWDTINQINPPNRTHTSLSVGDVVCVDGNVFRCEPTGWRVIGTETGWEVIG